VMTFGMPLRMVILVEVGQHHHLGCRCEGSSV